VTDPLEDPAVTCPTCGRALIVDLVAKHTTAMGWCTRCSLAVRWLCAALRWTVRSGLAPGSRHRGIVGTSTGDGASIDRSGEGRPESSAPAPPPQEPEAFVSR
jgi:hypothetical protein